MRSRAESLVEPPCYFSFGQEIWHSASHGIGLIVVLAGLPLLLETTSGASGAKGIAGCAVFWASLVALYTTSTIYHALPPSRGKQVFQVLDHSAIYLLIAGTYTPFTLGVLGGPWGWTLFGLIWTLAVLGIVTKAVSGIRSPQLSTAFYLLMGWLMLIAIRPLSSSMPAAGLLWLFGGGLLYTAGVAFFAWDGRLRYAHTAWHLFVLAGSGCHYYAVLHYSGL